MSILATELEWPKGTKFFEVQCRLGVWDVDGWDLDKKPEVKTLGGTVRITPRTPAGRIRLLEPDGKYRVVVAPPLTFAINEFTGKLVNTADNTEGVWVVDPASDTVDPKDFTYSAVVTPKVGSPFTVEFDGTVAINGIYDLANGTTVAPSRGVSVLESRIAKLEQGVTPDAVATALGFWLSATEEQPPSTMYGVPVIWLDTSVQADPSQYVPRQPTASNATFSYTIPADSGAEYYVDGAKMSAGTYSVPAPDTGSTTVTVTLQAAPGYTFKIGTKTTYSFLFESQPVLYDDAVLAFAPEFYWRLDDPVGTNYNAIKNRGRKALAMLGNTSGVFGAESIGVGATSFSHAAMSFLSGVMTGATAFTGAFVVKPTAVGAYLSGYNRSASPSTVHVYVGTTITVDGVDTGLAPGTVMHIAKTWDGAVYRTYVDGVEVAQKADATGPQGQSGTAAPWNAGENLIAGMVLDYSKAATPVQIKAMSDAVIR